MTTPMEDIPMPFSAVLRPIENSYNLVIEADHRTSTSLNNLAVPSGVSTIQFTWDGEIGVELCYSDSVKTSQRSGSRIEPQAGGGQRSAAPVQLPLVGVGGYIYFRLDRAPTEEDVAAKHKLGVVVIPIATL